SGDDVAVLRDPGLAVAHRAQDRAEREAEHGHHDARDDHGRARDDHADRDDRRAQRADVHERPAGHRLALVRVRGGVRRHDRLLDGLRPHLTHDDALLLHRHTLWHARRRARHDADGSSPRDSASQSSIARVRGVPVAGPSGPAEGVAAAVSYRRPTRCHDPASHGSAAPTSTARTATASASVGQAVTCGSPTSSVAPLTAPAACRSAGSGSARNAAAEAAASAPPSTTPSTASTRVTRPDSASTSPATSTTSAALATPGAASAPLTATAALPTVVGVSALAQAGSAVP